MKSTTPRFVEQKLARNKFPSIGVGEIRLNRIESKEINARGIFSYNRIE